MARLLRWLVRRLRPTTSVYCLACKRSCPTSEPASVLAWLDRHACTATARAAQTLETVITGERPRWE